MAFDKPTRNKLACMVDACRRLLTDDIREQLQVVYGIQPDGTALAVEKLRLDDRGREIAAALRQWLEHLAAGETGTTKQRREAAFFRMTHETAFTYLNRLAALRMCEEREHVIECVRRGVKSDGFVMYERLAGDAQGDRGTTYRAFLDCMFDELALDLGVLFDRRARQSLVFPGPACIESVLEELNAAQLAHLWKEDETIGWVYQYFHSDEERRQMRAESTAPRNSRELAVRNQFFTPRYVVEFLTDNTLGRIWYEMTRGQTALKDSCRYLVRWPNEIFLAEGDRPPNNQRSVTNDISQGDLLNQPVYIPYRQLKEPREIKMLDPACGSMHFGLYAFDLFETIYSEAWDMEDNCRFARTDSTAKPLRETYGNKEAFLRDVPRLIIEWNIHGIDIDPRAVQIAGLSLWLRAQRSWQIQRVKAQDRPRIERTNVVCAEPMPGEESLLHEFLNKHLSADPERQLLGQLVRRVFQGMKLAGDAGSLLKVEQEIAASVAEAKKAWLAGPEKKQRLLFEAGPNVVQQELDLDVSGITDDAFWAETEEKIYASLRAYAEHAENGGGYQRRLFVDDAARGFAFIDVCRKRYEVVAMNPPFGEPTGTTRVDLKTAYPNAADNLAVCFLIRAQELLVPNGLTSSITDCSWAKKYDYSGFRAAILESENLSSLVHLGWGVLDKANVETNMSVRGGAERYRFHPQSVAIAGQRRRISNRHGKQSM